MGLVTALESIRKTSEDLYVVEFPDSTEVLFRLPSTKQGVQYMQLILVAEGNHGLETLVYEHIFQECVEENYMAIHDQTLKAGIVESIAKAILYFSGADENFKEYTEALWEALRPQTKSVLSIMRRTICQVFSSYKFSDLDGLNYQDLVKVYVEAETVLLEQGIIEEGLKFQEAEKVKPFRVEDVIRQDGKDYRAFDTDEGHRPQLTDDHVRRAQQEEFRHNQRLRGIK